MFNEIKRLLIGRPLKNELIGEQKYGVLWGLPILASDAISSIAYATEEILIVLVPAVGILAYQQLTYISSIIIGLLLILTLSYRQTIQSYPSGGGAYIVASDNLGKIAGVTAGASLAIDYILTVAVSISAGTAAITSAYPQLFKYTVPVCILILFLLMLGNLRGVKESSRLFSLPAYAFIFAIITMIISGIIKIKSGYTPPPLPINHLYGVQPITLILLLSAFSNGCTALTGVEAVSNAIPNFKEPSVKHAKRVLALLAFFVLIMFGGTSLLANFYHVAPIHDRTVLSQIAFSIFGNNFMYYFIQVATAVILATAANTAYSGFPLLVSIMAKEGFAPRQLNLRGDRLSYSNGIILLSVIAGFLIVTFNGNTNSLIPLYAIGVFISFTLSQFGMLMKWFKQRGKYWHYKAFINGLGAFVTTLAVIIIAITKFHRGAWIVVLVIPTLVILMLKINKHYTMIAEKLRISEQELQSIEITPHSYRNHIIVPIASINRASIRALRYARTISNNVVAFNISVDEEDAKKIKNKWELVNTDIKLVVKYSPFRKIIQPLIKFIESEEHEYKKGDMITIVLPQFNINAWWQVFLHNQTRFFIANELLKHNHIVIATMPLQIKMKDEK